MSSNPRVRKRVVGVDDDTLGTHPPTSQAYYDEYRDLKPHGTKAHPKHSLQPRYKRFKNERNTYEGWDQFAHKKSQVEGRNLHDEDFRRFNQTASNHPTHHTFIRQLVTYHSKNTGSKDCQYGTYRDGDVIKCLRNPHHAPLGVSHHAGEGTGAPMGRPPGPETHHPIIHHAVARPLTKAAPVTVNTKAKPVITMRKSAREKKAIIRWK
jgi:hypothetical protein